MPQFTDSTGRTWTVAVDAAAMDRIRQFGHDPAGLKDGTLIKEFMSTRLRFVVFVYKLVQPQAKAFGVDASEFWRLSGRCFWRMASATREALKQFDPAAGELTDLEMMKWR
jgi:hypothetical protein